MRILVTGSREFTDKDEMWSRIDQADETNDDEVIVVHGAARGADQLAAEYVLWAQSFMEDVQPPKRVRQERHPADWDQFPRSAGVIRNQEMVDLGADVCLAFFKRGAQNKGTTDCVNRALKAGIPVRTYWQS